MIFPDNYSYSLDPERFYKFAILVLLLTPFQTTTEELLTRSYFLQMLGHFTRHPIVLVILNALPFALFHLMNPEIAAYGVVPMLVSYFVVGAFLALVTLKDNGAELAIGIHAANNMIAAVLVNYEGSALSTNAIFMIHEVNVWSGTVAYIVSAAIMYWILFRSKRPVP
ncbi:MAG: CPBP family intramembrane metalloprotease [Acidimicrobiales bacterium]|nr:CPBP family intramembrane metalloprotease [Acidimicrobiales bacterium]